MDKEQRMREESLAMTRVYDDGVLTTTLHGVSVRLRIVAVNDFQHRKCWYQQVIAERLGGERDGGGRILFARRPFFSPIVDGAPNPWIFYRLEIAEHFSPEWIRAFLKRISDETLSRWGFYALDHPKVWGAEEVLRSFVVAGIAPASVDL